MFGSRRTEVNISANGNGGKGGRDSVSSAEGVAPMGERGLVGVGGRAGAAVSADGRVSWVPSLQTGAGWFSDGIAW